MMRKNLTMVAVTVLTAVLATTEVRAQLIIDSPRASGDQLIFVYDTTGSRVPFFAVTNLANEPVTVETQFYMGPLNVRITSEARTIPANGNLPIIDPTDATRFPGVAGTAGLLVVTTVVDTVDTRPVVPPSPPGDVGGGPLYGGFTLANLDLNAAFGNNPVARIAVGENGLRAAPGTLVGGNVIYQLITPDVLTLPFYFNPMQLSPVANDGNRLILAAFADEYREFASFRIRPVTPTITLDYRFTDTAGVVLVDTMTYVGASDPVAVNGVTFTNLQALAGTAALTGQGKAVFISSVAPAANVNIFGIFSQAVGTFAVGQMLVGGTEVR